MTSDKQPRYYIRDSETNELWCVTEQALDH